MQRNNGMRPQDVAILLKILLCGEQSWMKKDLAADLFLSPAEVGHSLNRSELAGLVDPGQKKVLKRAFLEFLFHGFAYVFPVRPGSITVGIPTAYSAPVMKDYIVSSEPVVWLYAKGKTKGQSIEPLYKGAIEASRKDPLFYDILCLCDALRIGRLREKEQAKKILEIRLIGKNG